MSDTVLDTPEKLTEAINEILRGGYTPLITVGDSMLPVLEPHRLVRLKELDEDYELNTGTIYSFTDKETGRTIVKQLKTVLLIPDGKIECYFEGYNSAVSKNYLLQVYHPSEIDLRVVEKYPYHKITDDVIAHITKQGGIENE